MGLPPLGLKHILFPVVAVLNTLAIAQEGPIIDNSCEKDALDSLKGTFNHPFLNHNWTGIHCSMDVPPRWFGIQCANGRVTGIVLEGMGLTGEVSVNAFFNLKELSVLNLKNNSLRRNVMDFSNNHQMKYIDLSGNNFEGPISSYLLSLNLLESLLLKNNRLTGQIPEFNQSSLKIFDVSNNDLEGRIPTTLTLQSFGPASYSGNPKLCGPPSRISCNSITSSPITDSANQGSQNESSNKKDNSTLLIIFNVVLLIAVILLLMLYYNTARKLNKLVKGQIPTQKIVENIEERVETGEMRVMALEERKELIFFRNEPKFQMGELLRASAEALGHGIMGNSYKAMLHGGPNIVVKRLRDLKPMTKEEFAKLLQLIADLKHPNLQPLLAYYHSRDEKLLIYKYAENRNLFFRLHDGRDGNRIPFKWNSRLSVARGVARALEYLHNNNKLHTVVPHGNLKSSNVLLDENDSVLVSDYGLASLIAQPIAAQRMMVYKSPECGYARRVSKKSDVWSYGSLLLELLTGKVPASSAPLGVNGVDLCGWVHRAVREEWTAEIFDREIYGRSAQPGMLRLLQIALRCTDEYPENRPEMSEVVREVENIQAAPMMSEDEDDVSGDRSLTDDSFSTSNSGIIGEDK